MPDNSSQAAYRAFCATAPDVPLFAQPWYLDACAEGGTWDAVLALDKGQPVAALPYFTKQKGPFRYATMPPFVKWLGPYLLPHLRDVLKKEHLILQALIEQLPPLAAFKQNFYPTTTNWLPFYWNKFQQTTYYTYRLCLRDLPTVEAGYDADVRRILRKAAPQFATVHDLEPQLLFDFTAATFKKQGLSLPFSQAQYLSQCTALATHNAGKFFFAVDAAHEVHAVVLLVWDAHTAYFHLAADNPAHRSSGAGKYLIQQVIRYSAEVLKLDTFDFEGSILPGVEYVRLCFGATQVPYFFVHQTRSRLFRWLESVRK